MYEIVEEDGIRIIIRNDGRLLLTVSVVTMDYQSHGRVIRGANWKQMRKNAEEILKALNLQDGGEWAKDGYSYLTCANCHKRTIYDADMPYKPSIEHGMLDDIVTICPECAKDSFLAVCERSEYPGSKARNANFITGIINENDTQV